MREELNYRGAIIGRQCVPFKRRSRYHLARITDNALPEEIDFYLFIGANQMVAKPLSKAKLMNALQHFAAIAMTTEKVKE